MRNAFNKASDKRQARLGAAARATLASIAAAILAAMAVSFSTAFAASSESTEKWVAPASEATKKNPIARTSESIAAGQKVYAKRCAGCHGSSGNGDGPNAADLGIHPARLSEVAPGESDGSLFWKITTGKKPMPRYGGRLSETERWNVINYLRTLNKR